MTTFNADKILTQIQLGEIDPNWCVIYPPHSRLIKSPVVCILAIIISIIALYSIIHDNHVLVPTYSGGPLSQADFQLWRIIDYIFIGILLITAIVGLLRLRIPLKADTSKKPILILTPEGFILRQGHQTHAINYAEVVDMKINPSRAITLLDIKTLSSGQKNLKIIIDGRFSNARQIAADIINTHRSYAAGAIQQPQRFVF